MNEIRMTFCDMEDYKTFRSCICHYLKNMLPEGYTLVEVALNEAINNAFRHGAKKVKKPFVSVKLRVLNGRRLIMRVKDSGNGFCTAGMLEGLRRGFPEREWMDESGRGIRIIGHVMDLMKYNGKGNEILLVKRII